MRFSTVLLGVPVVVVAAVIAVANRQSVTVSLDPFSPGGPSLSASVPLFVLLFAAVALGAVLGGLAAVLSRAGRKKAAPPAKPAASLLPARLGGSKPPKE